MMKENAGRVDALEEKIKGLKPDDLKKALTVFRERIHHDFAAYLNSCVHCGLCSDSCLYYLVDRDVRSSPAHKLMLIVSVFKRYFSFSGRRMPWFSRAREFDQDMVREWVDSLFGRCTLCGRCFLNCSMSLNIPYLIRAARGALASINLIPSGLDSTLSASLEKGNSMGIANQDWVETVKWLEEELRNETKDNKAELPLDKKGARIFYSVNPREPVFFPFSLLAVGKIFHAAGEGWTFSSDHFDATNYGYYAGDDIASGKISEGLVQTMEKLGSKILVLPECGHGFNANRWEAPQWLSKKFGFEVKSILEVVADYICAGRIKLNPERNPELTTLHDPCNLVRLGGIIEEQRFILQHAVSRFVEMTPNREKNFCCGGGGGQLAMTRYSQRRIQAGRLKSDQIRKTGAKVVATPCHNCIDQLMELNKHYKLGVKIRTVCEIVADALVINSGAS